MPEPQKLNMHCFTEWLALVWYGGFIDYKYNAGVKKHPKNIWPAAVLVTIFCNSVEPLQISHLDVNISFEIFVCFYC